MNDHNEYAEGHPIQAGLAALLAMAIMLAGIVTIIRWVLSLLGAR